MKQIPLTQRVMIERRGGNIAPVLIDYVAKMLTAIGRKNVMTGRRTDEICVEYFLAWLSRAYGMVTGFVLAHALGYLILDKKTLRIRREHCNSCDRRRRGRDGQFHCYGFTGGHCDCGEYRWWPFGRLAYRQRLRNAVCPIGRFGRTSKTMLTSIPPIGPKRRTGVTGRPSDGGWVD